MDVKIERAERGMPSPPGKVASASDQSMKSELTTCPVHLAGPRRHRVIEPEKRALMILISANGLGRQFAGDPIFTDLKFEVRAGERIGLVGPNGAGKTTLMQLLAGQDQADYGNLYVRPGHPRQPAAAAARLRARRRP